LFGVLKPWLAYQVRSVVAATPLADTTPSDHDSPNAPATARSVYVIVHPAVRPSRCIPRSGGLLRPTPNPQAPKAKVNGAASLKAEARSTRRGLRVRVVDSLGRSFVENTKRRKRGGFIGLSFCLLNISAQLKVSNYTVSRHLLIEINF
jgi:hypothetical protein